MRWGLLGNRGVGAIDPLAADVEVRLAGAGKRFDGRIDDCRVQVCAGLVAGAGSVDGPVRIFKQVQDRWPVVEVHDGRDGAGVGDDLGLGVSRPSAVTSCPRPRNSVSTCDPMKPVAPVSAIFIVGAFLGARSKYAIKRLLEIISPL